MNVRKLAENALTKIKDMVDLPENGIIAGGALGNLIWEEVSGNKAVVNDVDIFKYVRLITLDDLSVEQQQLKYSKNFYDKKDLELVPTYNGMTINSKTADFFRIEDVKRDGLLNIIEIGGPKNSPQIIIDSFDINSCQIAYCISRDEFYWCDEFEEFLKTGQLEISNLMSPSHTAIRLVKKKDELGAKLNPIELKMCQYSIKANLIDINRRYFTEKYAKLYSKYHKEMRPYFSINISMGVSKFVTEKNRKEKNIDPGDEEKINLFNLDCAMFQTTDGSELDDCIENYTKWVIPEWIGMKIDNGNQLLRYVRHFSDIDPVKYSKLRYIIGDENYFNYDISDSELNFINNLVTFSKIAIDKLSGMTLRDQVLNIYKLVDRYDRNEKFISLYVLEHPKFDLSNVHQYSDDDYLLLELTKRKEIANRDTRRERKILGDLILSV